MKLWQWFIALFSCSTKELADELHQMDKEIDDLYKPARNHKKWSLDETATLVMKWQDNQSLAYIAYTMDRTIPSIKRKLNDLGYSIKHDALRVSKYDLLANKSFE